MSAQAGSVRLGEGGSDAGAGSFMIQLHVARDGVEHYPGHVVSKYGIRARLDAVGDRAIAVGEGWIGGVGGEGGRRDELDALGGFARELEKLWLTPERRADD